MKTVFVLLLISTSLAAQADIYRACENGTFDRRTERFCINNAANEDVVVSCDYATDDSDTLSFRECVKYMTSPDAVRYCDRQTSSWNSRALRECFRDIGKAERRSEVVPTHHAHVNYDHNEYMACYEKARRRVITIDQKKERRGAGKVLGGFIGALVGEIIGGKEGKIITAVSTGVAIYGAVEVSSARDIVYETDGYDCYSYYTVDTRYHSYRNRDGRRCTTRRYYTNRWNGTHEYFETTCSGHTYVTFERSEEIWLD